MRKLILLFFFGLTFSFSGIGQSISGKWTKKSQSIEGTWTVEKSGEVYKIVLSDDFYTKKAPDLKLFLSTTSASSISARNATSNAILISELKLNKGKQEYFIPKNIKLSDYQTLIIHCEEYGVLWGVSSINK